MYHSHEMGSLIAWMRVHVVLVACPFTGKGGTDRRCVLARHGAHLTLHGLMILVACGVCVWSHRMRIDRGH